MVLICSYQCLHFSYVDPKLSEILPNLSTLCLTNNNVQELGDLDSLAKFTKLEHLR